MALISIGSGTGMESLGNRVDICLALIDSVSFQSGRASLHFPR